MPAKPLTRRLDRLAGDGKNSGGGLPLPPLFQTVMAELVDHGDRAIGDLIGPVEKAVPKRERVDILYPENGYSGLVEDLLGQLQEYRLAAQSDGTWLVGENFAAGQARRVIPARKDKNQAISITVLSKEERDRVSVADRDKRELRSMYSSLLNERTFNVPMEGRKRPQALRLHPLARAIPQMSEKEFMDLGYDIKEHGVKVPIVLFDGQVLDGRHRVAAAAALQVSVRVDQFEGDEAAAGEHVVSLNLQRRNLNIPQRALVVQQLLLPQAEAEAEAKDREPATGEAHGSGQDSLSPTGDTLMKATQAAAARSHGLASARTLQRMQPVREAPRTQERIRRGEITSATHARREALAELGIEAPADIPAMLPRSAYMSMGQALYELRKANEVLGGDNPGRTPTEQYLSRLRELNEAMEETGRLINGRSTD